MTEQKSSSLLLLKSNNSVVVSSRRFVRGLRRSPVAVLYPGEERETLIKAAHQNKQRRQDPGTQQGQQHQTDGRRIKENSSEPRGRSSGVQADRCSVRAQLGGLRFDKALPGDKRLA